MYVWQLKMLCKKAWLEIKVGGGFSERPLQIQRLTQKSAAMESVDDNQIEQATTDNDDSNEEDDDDNFTCNNDDDYTSDFRNALSILKLTFKNILFYSIDSSVKIYHNK